MAKTMVFRPETPNDRWVRSDLSAQVGCTLLYRIFDLEMNLLYVGITNNPVERFRLHARKQPWWGEVAYIYSIEIPGRWRAFNHELEAIKQDRPRYNTNGAVA